MLSIVRQLYYHRCRPITPWPRVEIGAPDAWDQSVSASNKGHEYRFCTWSPCGRFVAAQTVGTVEIRSQLTFELLTTLQPTEIIGSLTGPLTYSPDGRSIACGSGTSILIWDIQTGGVARKIRCGLKNISMVWSSDGRKIGFIDTKTRVHTCDLVSGTTISPGKISPTADPYFWAHEESFRILTTVPSGGDCVATVEVLEVGRILTKISSFTVPWSIKAQDNLKISYSPTTRRFAISADHVLHIFKDQSWIPCPSESESISFHCFSPDGRLFAVVVGERIRVWKYASCLYEQWKELQCPGQTNSFLQFSPTQLLILGSFGNTLHGWRLHDLHTTPETNPQQHARLCLSSSGKYIATAYKLETTVTITEPYSQAPPHLIDTGVEVEGLAFTGNVLLVVGLETIVAWLLTEEGLLRGVFSSGRASRRDSIWTVSTPKSVFGPATKADGHVVLISPDGTGVPPYFIYNTETGEAFHPGQVPVDPTFSGIWEYPRNPVVALNLLCAHVLASPDGSWQISKVAVRDGWVKDPDGRYRLWVPVEWRASWGLGTWYHDIATQYSIIGGKPVIIKY